MMLHVIVAAKIVALANTIANIVALVLKSLLEAMDEQWQHISETTTS